MLSGGAYLRRSLISWMARGESPSRSPAAGSESPGLALAAVAMGPGTSPAAVAAAGDGHRGVYGTLQHPCMLSRSLAAEPFSAASLMAGALFCLVFFLVGNNLGVTAAGTAWSRSPWEQSRLLSSAAAKPVQRAEPDLWGSSFLRGDPS